MQDSNLEYLIWQFDKTIILSEKKPPLGHMQTKLWIAKQLTNWKSNEHTDKLTNGMAVF